ncbi:uncharacterized protein PHA67_006597 [Liasis olivaceus]
MQDIWKATQLHFFFLFPLVVDLFDLYTDKFMSGPLEPMFYTSLSTAVVDCLSDSNCTGIVQDSRFFRRTRGIDEITASDETIFTYAKRECTFGYYGDNCALRCKKCYGGFRCNSVTGKCPEGLYCIGQFKGEHCELGLINPKCPLNAPWWFYDGHCYYFEKEKKGMYTWADKRCSYYKDAMLVKIDSMKEKEWLGAMLERESWIGLQQQRTTWTWSGGRGNVALAKYAWLWNFPATTGRCAQMMKGGSLQSLQCSEQHFYICEIEIGCTIGRYGSSCEEECPVCRNSSLCNMVTGVCDEKTTCLDQSSLESCSGSSISERCPDMNEWRYWNRYCYYFVSAFKTWEEANSSCSRFRASELLWIEDQDDLAWLRMFIIQPIWVGLQEMNHDGIWAWSHEDSAQHSFRWMNFDPGFRWKRCAELSHGGQFSGANCYEKKKSACKRPAERDLDIFAGFWDSVIISTTLSLSANSSYNDSKDECIKKTECLGYGLWQNGYFLLNGYSLVGGGFGPSVMFLKSVCDHGYYGKECDGNCPRCHWEKLCHPVSGTCERPIICSAPESIGTCSLGLYSLKCSLGAGWWYWRGTCYLIEKNRRVTWKEALVSCRHFKDTSLLQLDNRREKVWLQEMTTQPMWVGLQWHAKEKEWLWGNGTTTNASKKWLQIEGGTLDSCGTLIQRSLALRSAKCNEKFHFICKRQEGKCEHI